MRKSILIFNLFIANFLTQPFAGHTMDPQNINPNRTGDLITLKGSIQKIRGKKHLEITLQSPTGIYQIELGPEWYFQKQGFELRPHDTIQVQGTLKKAKTKKVLARDLQKENKTLPLRDAQDKPTWGQKP